MREMHRRKEVWKITGYEEDNARNQEISVQKKGFEINTVDVVILKDL